MGKRLWVWLCLALLLLLVGCDEVAVEPTAPTENAMVANLPTRTIKPIVSFTPRFTATPIPSATLTPSHTPTETSTAVPPTVTPTVTPTITPTVSGVVRSTRNVNLREGPGEEYPIVRSVTPGTEMGVLGRQIDDSDREWYKVLLVDEDGEEVRLWIYGSLFETSFRETVVEPELPTDTPAPGQPTATPRPTREPNRVEILAYCVQKSLTPPTPTTNDNIYVEWSWFVSKPDLMEDHLAYADYEVRLDGELLDNWERYSTEVELEAGVWIKYWFYPVGQLEAGQHEIEYTLTWDATITDGYENFGPDTANVDNVGNCTFTVTES